jgi:hypothetical protein
VSGTAAGQRKPETVYRWVGLTFIDNDRRFAVISVPEYQPGRLFFEPS